MLDNENEAEDSEEVEYCTKDLNIIINSPEDLAFQKIKAFEVNTELKRIAFEKFKKDR